VGAWNDFSSAGYLLANAFRTNSSRSPDKLPAVKKWKAFQKEVNSLMKSVVKKDAKKSLDAYKAGSLALESYLDEVDLPNALIVASL